MGANQSNNENQASGDNISGNTNKSVGKTRLTYQESFDIRTRAQAAFVPQVYRKKSFSSSSSSESLQNSRPPSRASSRVRRNKSNIRPPIFIFSGGKTRGWDGGRNSNFSSRKPSVLPPDYDSQCGNYNAQTSRFGKMAEMQNVAATVAPTDSAQTSFDIDSDIEQEIDFILNDTSNGALPWYKHHGETGSNAGSSSTVSIGIEKTKDPDENEDLVSTKSLPTPSHYLYLTFDEDDGEMVKERGENMTNLDNKKSKSIEFLDGPNYFFLNYDDTGEADTTEAESDLPLDDVPPSK